MLSFTETLLKERETLENKTNIASEDIKMGLFQMRPFERMHLNQNSPKSSHSGFRTETNSSQLQWTFQRLGSN